MGTSFRMRSCPTEEAHDQLSDRDGDLRSDLRNPDARVERDVGHGRDGQSRYCRVLCVRRLHHGAAHREGAFAGKDVLKFKVKAFALGGALAGLAGALYAHYSSYIVPEIYVPLLTIYIFLALTAGGIGNNWGALVGAFVVVFFLESTRFLIGVVPWLSAEQLAALREFLVGLGLLLVLFLRPRGLMPEPLPRLVR